MTQSARLHTHNFLSFLYVCGVFISIPGEKSNSKLELGPIIWKMSSKLALPLSLSFLLCTHARSENQESRKLRKVFFARPTNQRTFQEFDKMKHFRKRRGRLDGAREWNWLGIIQLNVILAHFLMCNSFGSENCWTDTCSCKVHVILSKTCVLAGAFYSSGN